MQGARMNRLNKSLAATFLLAAMLCTSAAQAMEIRQFDKMAVQDQGDYIQALVDGAQKVLTDQGHRDLAVKVDQLFTEVHQGDTMPLGMIEFEDNLARARVADARNVIKDPSTRRIEVEDAMAVTLKKNGIVLPQSFFTVAGGFKPKHSPEKKKN
jgi:hypothetical protein